jgi:uncharacterized membrane protein YjgN (DUF898 family)
MPELPPMQPFGSPHPAATAPSPPPEPVRLSWSEPGGMLGLSIVNFLLRIVTIGVYHFWGKTEVRRRIWSSIRLNGEPLAYTGTGKELLLGFLVVFAVVVIPTMIVSFAIVLVAGPQSPLLGVFQIALYAFFFLLTGVAIHRAQRYRLSRTQWRGIRGGMAGNAWSFAWTYVWTALLIPFTLGWIIPWRSTKLQGLLTNDMRFGNRPFRFDALSGPLYPRFVGLWIGGVVLYIGFFGALFAIMWPGLLEAQRLGVPPQPSTTQISLMLATFLLFMLLYGLVSAWYRAGMMNHFAAHTTFEGARFSGRADAPSLIWLTISNFLILLTGAVLAGILLMLMLGLGAGGVMLATGAGAGQTAGMQQTIMAALPVLVLIVLLTGFGILLPMVQARSARYFVQRLSLDGAIPVAAIAQAAEDRIRRGEGLAQAFDVDAF